MAYEARQWADGELVTAEDVNRIENGLQATSEMAESTAAQVSQIARANFSAESLGGAAPSGAAPPGWVVEDLDTGDLWRMEA